MFKLKRPERERKIEISFTSCFFMLRVSMKPITLKHAAAATLLPLPSLCGQRHNGVGEIQAHGICQLITQCDGRKGSDPQIFLYNFKL